MSNLIILYILIINLSAYCAFYLDKRSAKLNKRRIPEKTLLILALIGGTLGAVIGQQTLRHKTQKQPFKTLLCTIIFLQLALAFVWITGVGHEFILNLLV